MRRSGVVLLVLAASAAQGAMLERVDVVHEPGVAVQLRLSSPVEPIAHTLPPDGEHPARIYLDLAGTTLATSEVMPGAGTLLRVRTGQFDLTTVRVVLDLAGPTSYAVRERGDTITIELAMADTPAAAEPVPPAAQKPVPAAPRAAPPSPPAAIVAPTHRRVVALDPGHGGYDPGATGVSGLVEKTITLDLARRVAARLAAVADAEVLLTRTDDSFVAIDDRIARAGDAAVFVSLHANAAADSALSGVEVFYGGGGVDAAAAGPGSAVRLGLDMSQAIEDALGDIRTVVRPGTFGVLVRNAVPSVLVEIGYLTNPSDAIRLGDSAYRDRVADAIASGAAAFLREPIRVAGR